MSDKPNIEIFKKIWNSRNPSHDRDPLGNDRFFQTAELIAREYYERLHLPEKLTIDELREQFETWFRLKNTSWLDIDKRLSLYVEGKGYEGSFVDAQWQAYVECAKANSSIKDGE